MFKVVKRFIPAILAIILVFGSFTTVLAAPTAAVSKTAKGIYTVSSEVASKSDKLLVEKDGVRYIYTLIDTTNVPLQLGNGHYSIKFLDKIDGNRYRVVSKETLNVSLENAQAPFLNSVQNINWDKTMPPIVKAQKLTQGLKTDKQKVTAIYNYVVNNYQYDYKKASTVKAGYNPNINDTFKTKNGICYDFASLFAAMLRSQNIPTKLVTGYNSYVKEYHAWNEVYLDGNWVAIDPTVDAVYKASHKKTTMIKDSKNWKIKKVY